MRQRKTDYGTIILHWTFVAAFAVALVTGLRIATETPDRTWINDQPGIRGSHSSPACITTSSMTKCGENPESAFIVHHHGFGTCFATLSFECYEIAAFR